MILKIGILCPPRKRPMYLLMTTHQVAHTTPRYTLYEASGKQFIGRQQIAVAQHYARVVQHEQRGRMGDLCEGSQALQAASHSSSKAALPPKGSEQQAVLGRVGLIGTVGSAKLLDGFVGRPGQLKGQVHPPLLVLGTPALHSFESFRKYLWAPWMGKGREGPGVGLQERQAGT